MKNREIVLAESVYSESYQMLETNLVGPGFSKGTRSYNENSDKLLTVFENDLKVLDEKLVGKNYKYASMIGNFAGVLLRDNSMYIISASDERAGVNRPLVMKYDIQKKTSTIKKLPIKERVKTCVEFIRHQHCSSRKDMTLFFGMEMNL